jgi:hypothetical protein
LLTVKFKAGENTDMSNFAASSSALRALASEAESLLNQAKKYREEMEALPKTPEGDAQRQIYEKMIRDLLERSRRLSVTVTTSATSS